MQAIAYEGYFSNGCFYASGKVVQIPEKRRVVITILEDISITGSDKQMAWHHFKRMVKESAHENHLLERDIFNRQDSGRELIIFADGADGL